MKVLVSAIACSPYLGSENFFGWAAVKCLARVYDLWVITSPRNRADLERAAGEGIISENVHFAYAGEVSDWHPNSLRARIQSWQEFAAFAKDSLSVARELHRAHAFDVVHHVTYSTWRVASPMWKLGIPFVLGPLAGNEPFPFRLYSVLSATAAAFETVRKLSNTISPFFPAVRRSIRSADHIFAITEESENLMRKVRGSSAGISKLSAGFYSAAKAAEFSRFASPKNTTGTLRLYAAGNLGGQKCISIALRGLAIAKRRGVKFHYHLGSSGPEIPHLKKLAIELDLKEEVLFGGTLSREEYQRELGRTHLYLLPSMRETVGLTMMEAMLAGCVPIVADTGGPKVTVTPECGYKIAVSKPGQMAEEIAKIVEQIDRDRALISQMGCAASQRIQTAYTDDHYLGTVGSVYRRLTEARRASMS